MSLRNSLDQTNNRQWASPIVRISSCQSFSLCFCCFHATRNFFIRFDIQTGKRGEAKEEKSLTSWALNSSIRETLLSVKILVFESQCHSKRHTVCMNPAAYACEPTSGHLNWVSFSSSLFSLRDSYTPWHFSEAETKERKRREKNSVSDFGLLFFFRFVSSLVFIPPSLAVSSLSLDSWADPILWDQAFSSHCTSLSSLPLILSLFGAEERTLSCDKRISPNVTEAVLVSVQ